MPTRNEPTSRTSLFSAKEIRIIACSLLLCSEESSELGISSTLDARRDVALAGAHLRQMSSDISHLGETWAAWDIDIVGIATRLQQVPDEQACQVYVRVMRAVGEVSEAMIQYSLGWA
jgi:hypothetical protein